MKSLSLFALCSSVCLALIAPANGDTLEFSSSQRQTTLVELFTSEGCSSCPPADRWLNDLRHAPGLWREFIPLAFHVDYWNYLGWRDPFSDAMFSQRQRNYARRGYARSVYTPGFFVAGREWRGWFRNPAIKLPSSQQPGILTLRLTDHDLKAEFQPKQHSTGLYKLNVAVLGFDIRTPVSRGENQGRTLMHDFVVLTWLTRDPGANSHWRINRKELNLSHAHAKAIAAWVSQEDDPTPLQATGGWLTND